MVVQIFKILHTYFIYFFRETLMKNAYLTSYFPLLSMVLFSLSLAIRMVFLLLDYLKETGIYNGMLEFFSDSSMKLSLLVLLLVLFFMLFATMKIIADTLNEVSLLFFSKDYDGESLKKIRKGPVIYLVGAAASLFSINSFIGIGAIFVLTTLAYFIYFVFSVSSSITTTGLIGMIFFQVLAWSTLILGLLYLSLKVYNSIMASLPV
jgi:hypothetical protein